ncbi:alcohol dehydrogenase catalytic domain-containing protein [Streptomyces sp. SID12501]|uniref:alcohol dehydrogenase catalytic domain-containing protein n=1 Tax=Streptomyces sp. SID12501 TaxID=2706042 RepID=UPI001EF33AFA|nr:alcohol dehydrogenase catalytic domain-containing protein [Streptomyces sp. SID12501]
MRAAVWYGAKDVRVENVPMTPPGPGEVTIEVAYCGICGSDLHEYADGPHAIPVGDPHPESGVAAPIVLGHEFCGTVTQVGGGVTGVSPGERVAVEPHYRCGNCPRCLAGEYNICRHFGFAGLMGHGGLAEHTTVPAYMLHRLPEQVSLEQAAVFEPAAVALHAVRRAGIRPGESVAVLGLGPIGLLVTQLAARYGAGRIVAADRSSARRELALRLGAAETGADLADVVGGEGADLVFEAVGSEDTLRACLAATRRGGRVMFPRPDGHGPPGRLRPGEQRADDHDQRGIPRRLSRADPHGGGRRRGPGGDRHLDHRSGARRTGRIRGAAAR